MKIDCSITDNYLKEKIRMCKNCYDGCPLSMCNNGSNAPCDSFVKIVPTLAIDVVQNWSDANPQKTYLEDLIEKYPNVKLGNIGAPKFCPDLIGLKNISKGNCINSCDECWNQIMEDQK